MNESSMKLESGTVEAVHNNQADNPLFENPIFQITSLGKVPVPEGETIRYKANLSDGVYYMKGIFSSDFTTQFDDGSMSIFTMIKVGGFSLRTKDGVTYLYVQKISEYKGCKEQTGNPVNISTGNASFSESQPSKRPGPTPQPRIQSHSGYDDENTKRTRRESTDPGTLTAINMLNPFHNKWIIKGIVVTKGDIKRFTNPKGEGKLFNFEVSDGTAQVRITCFSESVDVFYPIIEVGKAYTITKGSVKMANKQYSTSTFDYEIVLDKNSEIQHATDEGAPKYFFNFTKISDLALGSTYYDVIGVVREIYPPSTILVKTTQNELLKRDAIIVDESGSVRLTLWGPKADLDIENGSVLALKSVKANEFNGISISTISNSQVLINPDISEAHELAGWYQSIGKDIPISLPKREEKRKLIQEVKENELVYSSIHGTILLLKDDVLWYTSCQGEGCYKKVVMEDNGCYRCERCNMTYDDCDYKYMVSMHIGDFTGQIWLTLFDDAATEFFGISVNEMKTMSEESPDELQSLIKGMYLREYLFKTKARQENYNDEVKTRYTGLNTSGIDIINESRRLLDVIEKM